MSPNNSNLIWSYFHSDRDELERGFRRRVEYLDKKCFEALRLFLERQSYREQKIIYPSKALVDIISLLIHDYENDFACTEALTETKRILKTHDIGIREKKLNRLFWKSFRIKYRAKLLVSVQKKRWARIGTIKKSDPRYLDFKESTEISAGITMTVHKKGGHM